MAPSSITQVFVQNCYFYYKTFLTFVLWNWCHEGHLWPCSNNPKNFSVETFGAPVITHGDWSSSSSSLACTTMSAYRH